MPAFIWAWYTLSVTLKSEATEKLCSKHHQNGNQPRFLPSQRSRENQLPNGALSLPPALLKNRRCRISLWISLLHSSPFWVWEIKGRSFSVHSWGWVTILTHVFNCHLYAAISPNLYFNSTFSALVSILNLNWRMFSLKILFILILGIVYFYSRKSHNIYNPASLKWDI